VSQSEHFSRACRRVVYARSAFEPSLKTLRIFAEIMHETGERRSSRSTKLLTPNAPQFCNSSRDDREALANGSCLNFHRWNAQKTYFVHI
jgi:hypothetical protein